jgi:uroporphyrinogen-III synthase
MSRDAMPAALEGCYVISLRPVAAHGGMRRAAAAHGARLLALSPWRIVHRADAGTRAALDAALAAPRVVFTSPPAVAAARVLRDLGLVRGTRFVAVGTGTARALRRAGVADVETPARMDSEGLLALPALQSVDGLAVGLVTAPGGRGVIAATLAHRGASLRRADVYERIAVPPAPQAVARLCALDAPLLLALGSGEALETLLARLPQAAIDRLRRARVAAASARLAARARALGFDDVVEAADATPRALLAACAAAAGKP